MSGKQKPEQPIVELVPAPAHLPKIDLRNASAIRREMAAIYRAMRSGEIETADGTKFCYVLVQLSKLYEMQVIEERLQALEEAATNEAD